MENQKQTSKTKQTAAKGQAKANDREQERKGGTPNVTGAGETSRSNRDAGNASAGADAAIDSDMGLSSRMQPPPVDERH